MPSPSLSRSVLRQKRLLGVSVGPHGWLAGADAAGERVVVAVRVLDRHEPQLGAGQQVGDLGVVLVLDDPAHEAPLDLGGDPLARVVVGGVEDGRPRAVGDVARVLRDLEDRDRLAERRRADPLVLDDVAVLGGQLEHLVVDAARLHERAVDAVERVRALVGGAAARRSRRPRPSRAPRARRRGPRAASASRLREHDPDRLPVVLAGVVARVLEVDARLRRARPASPSSTTALYGRSQSCSADATAGAQRAGQDGSDHGCRRSSAHPSPLT